MPLGSPRAHVNRATCHAMKINFTAGDRAASFERHDMTGRAELRVGDEIVPLQSPFRLTTHFDFRTRAVWRHTIDGHDVEIARNRPRWFGGLRTSTYSVTVDGHVVATGTGK
jgi:hypothetical protein